MGTSPAGGVVRGARAAFLSSLVLSLAVCGHVLGGGDWPSAGALGGSALLATVMASVLTRVQLRMGRLVAALAAGQVAVHQLLSLTTGHGTIGHDHAAEVRQDLEAPVAARVRATTVLIDVAAGAPWRMSDRVRADITAYLGPELTFRAG